MHLFAGTYCTIIMENLEGTLEHQTLHAGLAQCHQILFGKFDKTLLLPQN